MITFESVSKTYDTKSEPALADVSFTAEAGEFVFLTGASGSGKSTVIRLALREEVPTRGRIRVAGRSIVRMASWKVPYLRRNIGTVFQDFRLLPNKTVFENVAFALQVIGKSRAAISTLVPDVLSTVGLTGKERRYPHELSGGEQQRVAIARAVVNKPGILLADEPTGNLDPVTSEDIMKVLLDINRTGTTVLMATHDEEIVNRLDKRVIRLEDGRMMSDVEHGRYEVRTGMIPVVKAEDADAGGSAGSIGSGAGRSRPRTRAEMRAAERRRKEEKAAAESAERTGKTTNEEDATR
ncbi:cell division ATP-binding protein FtsE [Brevibacterium litoralis]|uniref:cell division ATP-binding protein FtsE n=1 Tax=Brevibacterium litoralis TaxID=3138935 RepID=UPI0032F09C1B